MPNLDRQQLIGALVLVVSALFVSRGLVRPRYQAWIKRASIAGFVLTLGIVLVWVVAWLMSRSYPRGGARSVGGSLEVSAVTPAGLNFDKIGAPEGIRTPGLCLRRAALYPAELRVPR